MKIIDITIQFGKFIYSSPSESFIWKLITPTLSGVISFGVAYFIFSRGQRIAKRKEKERLKEVREYFYITLLKFRIGIDTQISIFDNNIINVNNDTKKSISIHRPASYSIVSSPVQILSISKNDTFKFFIQNGKEKHKRIKIYSTFYDLLLMVKKIKKNSIL